jgi:hypothetical protein
MKEQTETAQQHKKMWVMLLLIIERITSYFLATRGLKSRMHNTRSYHPTALASYIIHSLFMNRVKYSNHYDIE